MRKKLAGPIVALSLLATGMAEASPSQAIEWAGNGYRLAAGQNGFLNHKVNLYASDVVATASAIGCAGIREVVPVVCEEYAGSGAGVTLAHDVFSEPDLHNHSTFEGTFRGFYYS